MQTIVINNQKGGVGKTMLAVHLAWFLAEEGARVLFVDLDGQGNSSKVLQGERQVGSAADLFDANGRMPTEAEAGISVMGRDARIEGVQLAGVTNVVRHFKALGEVFDFCVFDTPPAWDARNFAAMAVCDHLLAPIELKSFALDGVAQLLRSVQAVEEKGRQGRKINFLGLIASRFNSHDAGERGNLKAVLEKVGTKLMFPGVITVRGSYEQAMNDRVPVWSIKSSGAKVAGAEIRGILTTVRDRTANPSSQEAA
jgi:chromosome partitioning protein